MRSLDSFFGNIDDDRIADAIELNAYQTHSGENYNVLRCNDVADNDAMLEFVVHMKGRTQCYSLSNSYTIIGNIHDNNIENFR